MEAKNTVFKVEGLQLGFGKDGRNLASAVQSYEDVRILNHSSVTYHLSDLDSHFTSLNLNFLN